MSNSTTLSCCHVGHVFLRAMFLSEMSEAKQELIEIKDFDGDAIQDLVHFAYSSKLTLTVDNVQPLLYAACILQVKPTRTRTACVCVCLCVWLFF